MSKQSKNFCFTLNNYSEDEVKALRSTIPVHPIRWIGFEEEVGESGTPHLQGVMVLYTKATLASFKKLDCLKRAHLEVMKGRIEHSEVYCSKEGKFESYGDKPMSQKDKGECEIKRFDDARLAARESRFDDIPSDIYVRHYGALHKIARDSYVEPQARAQLENYWIFGPSGCGKSRGALQMYGDRAYLKKCDNKWWDGYDPSKHDVVIIEDICPKQSYQMTNFKIWSDHRAFLAETKGGTLLIRPTIIVVTANHSIDEVFADRKEATEEDVNAIKRRFCVINMYLGTRTPMPSSNYVDKTATVVALLSNGIVPFDETAMPLKKKKKTETVDLSRVLVPWEIPTEDPALVFNNPVEFNPWGSGLEEVWKGQEEKNQTN